MPRFAEKIVGIAQPYAEKHGVSITSTWEGYVRDIGRDLDRKKIKIDQALSLLDKRCEYSLGRNDKKDILRALEKIS